MCCWECIFLDLMFKTFHFHFFLFQNNDFYWDCGSFFFNLPEETVLVFPLFQTSLPRYGLKFFYKYDDLFKEDCCINIFENIKLFNPFVVNTIVVLLCGISVATLYQDLFSSFRVFSCHIEDDYDKETVGKSTLNLLSYLLTYEHLLILENYCWSRLYYLKISASTGGNAGKTEVTFTHHKDQIYVQGFKTVIFYLCAEISLLCLPFCFWSSIDKQQALRKIGMEVSKMDNSRVKSTHVLNFFIKSLNSHGLYVKMFLATELLNLVFSFISFSFLCFYWEIKIRDALNFFLKDNFGQISDLFPLQTGCTYEQRSINPHLGNDWFETACFHNINEVYRYLIAGLYIWLFFLMVLGAFNFTYRIMQVCFKQFRAICLKQSAGHISLNVNIHLLVQVLSFYDYFVIENLSRHVENEVFIDFCNSLLEELSPEVP